MSEVVMQVECPHCRKALKSRKPLRVGESVVRCPLCGQQFRVEAAPAAPAPPPPAGPMVTTPFGVSPTLPDPRTRPSEPWASPPAHPATPPSWANRTPAPGEPVIPGYTILGEVGRGGMGVVYKARHERLKRVVALKLLAVGPEFGSQGVAGIQAEAEAVARLHHPNIIQIFEIGEHLGRPYLALEFATGGTLKGRLGGEPQPIRAAAQLIELLARAVHAAHLRGIVHRDLKPANILLDPPSIDDDHEGPAARAGAEALQLYGVPKITDFGLAKRIDDDHAPHRAGEVSGTPLYMAPEQAKGQVEDIGPATDIYALGTILYELLTGRTPFASSSLSDLIGQVVSTPPTPPRQLRRQIPKDLEAICLRCLEKDPRRRYRTAQALADDARRFLQGEPVRARPASPPARLWHWCLRNPIPASLLLTVTVVATVGQWSLFHLSRSMVEQTALDGAAQQTQVLKEVNKLYTEVVTSAKKAGVEATHHFPDDEKSVIPIPARFTILLGERVEGQADEDADGGGRNFLRLQMYSNYPFRERPGSPPRHHFGVDALKHYETGDPEKPYYRFDKYNGLQVLRYATPLIMSQRCLACHNDKQRYPALQKTDWKVGDVRGVLEIICPLDESLDQTRRTLSGTYTLLGITAAALLGLCWAGLSYGRWHRRRG